MGNVREVSSYSVTRGVFLVTKGFFSVAEGGDSNTGGGAPRPGAEPLDRRPSRRGGSCTLPEPLRRFVAPLTPLILGGRIPNMESLALFPP